MLGSRSRACILLALVLLGMVVAGCRSTRTQSPPTPTKDATATLSSALPPTVRAKDTGVAPDMVTPASPWEGETMILTVVFDNNPYDPRLETGWGFAAWLEYAGQTVLFDTGANGVVLLDNMATLGLDPKAIDIVVLSHIHGDHTGGLASLLALNHQVTVYLPQAFPVRFKEQVSAAGASVVEVDAPQEILPGLWSTGPMGTDIVEQALVARTEKGLVVVTGCAHPGVDEMVSRARQIGRGEIALVVGGFHLGAASGGRVEEIIGEFRRLGVQQVAPCHCTGDQARKLFREAYGTNFYACGAGWQWQGQAHAWRSVHQGIPAQIGVAAVAIAPGDPRVVYLAAYEPGGLYRSADGGDSWQAANRGLEAFAPLAIAVHPEDPDLAWVGTVVGGYRTIDGGQSWKPVDRLPPVPIYTLVVTPDGRRVYAAGEAVGVWRSNDSGQTWEVSGAGAGPDTVLSLALTPDGRVLAGTAGQGVWHHEDGGEQWQVGGSELAQAHVSQLAAVDSGRLYALAEGNLYLSAYDGENWQRIGPPDFEALSFAAEPGAAGRLYLGSKGGGLAISRDGGQSWDLVGSELRHTDITCLAVDPGIPGRAFLGTRYHGLYRTDDGGLGWTLVSAEIGRPVLAALAQDPADSQVFYAGALDGVYRSDDGGEHWRLVSGDMGKLFVQSLAVSPTGAWIYAGAQSGIYVSHNEGATWRWAEGDTADIAVFDLVVDPHDADRIYAGSWGHNILRSNDGGQTWAPIHHGLETLSVHALAVDPVDPQMLYAGTVEALYRSTDGGQAWQASPVANRPMTIFALVIDPEDPARVYAGATEGVYLSVDSGHTWQPAGHASLNATVTALTLHPDDANMILAGTEHHGLYRSADDGTSWQRWGLDGASVYAVLVDSSSAIWLGTDRGIFRDR
jgi:7,8-dihydropterin-6-yl-methyl-4-(beta-D-ribofuranosyl)aminobenzene 5'-phosphate synthase